MSLTPGTRLGPYEILSALGAGGMGEVYKARDTRLDRTVAIKVLPGQLADDPQFRDRFEREAKAIASLTHPNICTLHDVGHQDTTEYLVMEYLKGETLESRLKKGALPLDQALKTAIEVASALDNAHRAGIVHRDLKPGNVMLTKTGAKLLDFGLAKASAPVVAGAGLSMLPTTPPNLTAQGTILGTFQYMAPEQLEGQEADARTDIFAFGAVVYEMLTGKKAFEGRSQASLIGAIMHAEPPAISAMQPLTPPSLNRIISTCLAKGPDERWQSVRDLLRELKWIETGAASPIGSGAPLDRQAAASKWWILGAAVFFATTVGLALTMLFTRAPQQETRAVQFSVDPPEGGTFGGTGSFAISPDGTRIVFVASRTPERDRSLSAVGQAIWIRALDTGATQLLSGTEGATFPFWAPDGHSLGFGAGGKLRTFDLATSRVQVLADAPAFRGATWNRDGAILFSPAERTGLFRVSPNSAAVALTMPDLSRSEYSHRFPEFLSDSRHYVFRVESTDDRVSGDYVGSLDSQEKTHLVSADTRASYSVSGHLLYVIGGTLFAHPFDQRRFQLFGEPIAVARDVQFNRNTAAGSFAVSPAGLTAFRTGQQGTPRQLGWFDRTGRQVGTVEVPARDYSGLDLSPDGDRLGVHFSTGTALPDIWTIDLAKGIETRVTSNPAWDQSPIWSPDGKSILFYSDRIGQGTIFLKAANGAGEEGMLVSAEIRNYPDDWSPDSRFIVYESRNEKTGWDLNLLPQSGGRQPVPLLHTPSDEREAKFSPDGRWIAYTSTESGQSEVYVQAFPLSPMKVRVSNAGGFGPRWRRDGMELFYLSPDRVLTSVMLSTQGSALQATTPKALFPTTLPAHNASGSTPGYVVSADGQRFLVPIPVVGSREAPLTVIVNWPATLRK